MRKPRDAKHISYKWIYNTKSHTNGSIERCKDHFIARGCLGQDYDKTFSSVANIIVRLLLALATTKYWNLWQMDVNNPFTLSSGKNL